MNQYGFADADPINLDDSFGLATFVQCRNLVLPLSGGGNQHCAIRVKNDNVDVLIELIPENRVNSVEWRFGREAEWGSSESSYHPTLWKEVIRPDGVSEEEFDRAVLNSALAVAARWDGRDYTSFGEGNSNRFVYEVLKEARSTPPGTAVSDGMEAPGLCGGKGFRTGDDCNPKPGRPKPPTTRTH